MRVLITGAAGQAGTELQRTAPSDMEVIALDAGGLDITDGAAAVEFTGIVRPELIINAAAYTAVDRAEEAREDAYAVNATGAANLARAAKALGARLIHISTDFVFDGGQSSPYLPEDTAAPLGVYGASKWEGEQAVRRITDGTAVIIRTAWLYAAHGQNFVNTMLRLMGDRERLGVVSDQIGTPTWAHTLAQAIWAVAQRPGLSGTYHWSDAGVASWYDFAVAIQEEGVQLGLLDKAIPITPLRTSDYPTAARRPPYSVLDKTSAWRDFEQEGRHWRVCLREMMKELTHA